MIFKDLDETLRQWKERYTADLHAILEKIQDLKKHYDQQLEKIMQLEALVRTFHELIWIYFQCYLSSEYEFKGLVFGNEFKELFTTK